MRKSTVMFNRIYFLVSSYKWSVLPDIIFYNHLRKEGFLYFTNETLRYSHGGIQYVGAETIEF
jgi:hypothetical protein